MPATLLIGPNSGLTCFDSLSVPAVSQFGPAKNIRMHQSNGQRMSEIGDILEGCVQELWHVRSLGIPV